MSACSPVGRHPRAHQESVRCGPASTTTSGYEPARWQAVPYARHGCIPVVRWWRARGVNVVLVVSDVLVGVFLAGLLLSVGAMAVSGCGGRWHDRGRTGTAVSLGGVGGACVVCLCASWIVGGGGR